MSSRAPRTTIGKYRVLAELGRGGVAHVYLACAEGPAASTKLVVLKVLRPIYAHDEEVRALFLHEARLAARLHHPNVVESHELGVDGDDPFLAMEWLDGQSLAAIRRAEWSRPLPIAFHLRVVADVLAGLHHAHELTDYDGTPLALVHRDVNPNNVFVTYDGQVKLLDFGIAKAIGGEVHTQAGIVRGTVGYLAPEQLLGLDVDRRADLFAVGVMLWEAATRVRMARGKGDAALVQSVVQGALPRPRTVCPDVPEPLDAICMKALARKPEDRFATAAEMQDALERILATVPGALTAREMGARVGELFAERRAEMRALLGARLAPPPPGSEDEATLTDHVASDRPRAARRLRAWHLIVAVGVVMAVAASWLAGRAWRAETPVAITRASADARTTSHVRLSARPASARFVLDGLPLDGNPVAMSIPRDARSHLLAVSAPGFAPRATEIRVDRDLDLQLALEPIDDAAADAPP